MRIAVVTGASSGMGREFVRRLPQWERFDEVWVIARRTARLEEVKMESELPVRVVGLDLSDEEALEYYSQLLDATRPDVGLLANIAGFGRFGRYDKISTEDALAMIDLNCKALVSMTQRTLPYMHRGAKLMNLDSLSAFQPVPYLNVYAASKAFVLSYTRALARELAPRGIRVMAVCPGWVKTEFFEHALKTDATAVSYYNKIYEPGDVMNTALRDLYRSKKDVSVHGLRIRNQVRLVKLLPHGLVMKIWLRQQKLDRLPEED